MEPTPPPQELDDDQRPTETGELLPATVTAPSPGVTRGPFAPGALVAGRFRVKRAIAEGGMGVVYLAVDEKLNQLRALKVAKLGFAGQLSPEARSALAVTHPNVCRVFEIHTAKTADGPVDFLSMEFIDGGTLSRRLKDKGAFAEPEARRLAEQICAGLAASHARNLLHRDLKSNNVLLTDANGELRAVVTDFGLAQQPAQPAVPSESSDPYLTGVAGTPEYLAPERWKGKPASVASDIYALGIVLHELISGRRPSGKPREPRIPDAKLPARWRTVIARCLAEDPAKRIASAAAVAEALTGRAARRRLIMIASAAALLLAAALWGVFAPVTPPARLAIFPIEAQNANAWTASIVRGASYDLSNRLSRLNPRPPQLVVIPIEETQGLSPRDPSEAKQRIGASHILRASVTPNGNRLLLRAAIVDTSTQVVMREISTEMNSPAEGVTRLSALVAAAFKLPRQSAPEEISPEAYANYAEGMSYLRTRQQSTFQKAIAEFEKAIQQDPRSPLPPAGIAEACYLGWQLTGESKWLERGRQELARATALNPDSLAVHLAAGKLNLAPGFHDRAAQEFQRAVQLDAASTEAWLGLAKSYEAMEGRKAEAAEAYLKAIQLQPEYFAPLADFADFQRRMGNHREAEKLWTRVIQIAPESSNQRSNFGALLVEMDRWDDAERELKHALEINPRQRLALNNLGALYQYRKRDADAVVIFERARAIGNESHILALNLGDSYRRMGNAAKAAEAYGRGRKLAEQRLLANPGDAVTRAFVAYFALRLGDRKTAAREIVQALHFGEKDRTVIRRAVLCFEAMQQRDRTLGVLQTAPPDVLRELNRQPDLVALQKDPRFQIMLPPVQTP